MCANYSYKVRHDPIGQKMGIGQPKPMTKAGLSKLIGQPLTWSRYNIYTNLTKVLAYYSSEFVFI